MLQMFRALTAVNGVDFSVEDGEILGMIGPNGAGKSTLFNVIAGVYKPDRGAVVLKGKDISGLKPTGSAGQGLQKPPDRSTFHPDDCL